MTVGDRIKQKRCELELSQSDLAKRANYSDKTRISKIENSGDDISMKQIKRIAEALNVSTAYLLGWEDSKIEIDVEPTPDVKRALELYKKYAKASPDIQSAIETLLRSVRQG